MQEHTVKGALKELKGQILNTWETLADEELEKAKENVTELSEMFQKKVGDKKELISKKVSHLLARFNAGFEPVSEVENAPLRKPAAKKRDAKTAKSNQTKHN